MTVLQRIAEREPELKRELRTSIELMLPYAGAALRARARRVMKELGTELSPTRRTTAQRVRKET
jgi:hypothetical protein